MFFGTIGKDNKRFEPIFDLIKKEYNDSKIFHGENYKVIYDNNCFELPPFINTFSHVHDYLKHCIYKPATSCIVDPYKNTIYLNNNKESDVCVMDGTNLSEYVVLFFTKDIVKVNIDQSDSEEESNPLEGSLWYNVRVITQEMNFRKERIEIYSNQLWSFIYEEDKLSYNKYKINYAS